MQTKPSTPGRRVVRRYGAGDRERLLEEQAQSGLTKKAFCGERGLNLATFYGWRVAKRAVVKRPRLAEVAAPGLPVEAAVEVLLPNGVRVGIRHHGRCEALVGLVRGVAGYAGGV